MIMEIIALSKSVKISPRKVRIVADTIRNLSVMQALTMLKTARKRGADVLETTLKSALANAIHNAKLQKDNLIVGRIEVMEGPVLKRYHPSSRGRVHPYKKRSSHIKIVLKEKSN